MSSNKINDTGALEERTDLSGETATLLTSISSTSDDSDTQTLSTSLALLLIHEKKCRLANDAPSLVKVCKASLEICHDRYHDHEALLDTLKVLAGRRSQKSQVIGAMVQMCVQWVLIAEGGGCTLVHMDEQDGGEKAREELVVALRDITDGKIFLEAERARLTRALAIIKEQNGDLAAAADVLQEVHVETYGSLSKKEKVEFILEQMRLTLAKKDYVRAHIVGNKINRKALGEEGMECYKIRFFELMVEYHRHEKDAYELSKDYHAIYLTHIRMMANSGTDTPVTEEETKETADTDSDTDEKWMPALRATVLFLALSPHTPEQNDTLHRISADTNLEKIEACSDTVRILLRKEIVQYPLPHQAEMESWDAFTTNTSATTGEGGGEDLAGHWKKTFRKRIIQHNVRVAALYYRRIKGQRLATLLGLEPQELESEVADMVSNAEVYAKIDRPNDVIRFQQKNSPEAVLSNWASDISTLLHLVETTSNLIQKENMTQ